MHFLRMWVIEFSWTPCHSKLPDKRPPSPSFPYLKIWKVVKVEWTTQCGNLKKFHSIQILREIRFNWFYHWIIIYQNTVILSLILSDRKRIISTLWFRIRLGIFFSEPYVFKGLFDIQWGYLPIYSQHLFCKKICEIKSFINNNKSKIHWLVYISRNIFQCE